MLAGLLVAPSRYAPTNNLEKSQNRANVILGLMEQQGFLSASRHNTLEKTQLNSQPKLPKRLVDILQIG